MNKRQTKVTSPAMPENELRDLIAWRIADERKKKYPEFGGAKQCAEDIGIVGQQWSQYENGGRKPKLDKLEKMAKFFGVPLEHFTTPPEDWESKRREWKNRIKPGRLPRYHTENMADDRTVAQTDEPAEQADTAERDSAPEAQTTRFTTMGAIEKLIQLDRMHAQGEIPAPVHDQTMEAINRFLELALAHRTPKTTGN